MDNFYNNHKDISSYLKKDYIENYDLINEIYDFTLNKDLSVDKDGFYITRGTWYKKFKDGPEVIYKLNPDGFRSRKFEKLNQDKTNILYAGCSFTYGEGLPEEFTWTKMLTNKISFNCDVADYNIAYPGASIFTIIKNAYAFINKYGKPNFLFMCLPPITRFIDYDRKLKKYYILYLAKSISLNNKDKNQIQYFERYKYENNIFIYSLMLHMFESFCSLNNIKLVWTTWDEHDGILYNEGNFNNYIDLDFVLTSQPNIENIDNLPYWELAEDLGHPGTKWSTMICDKMFMEVKGEKNIS